MSNRVDCINKQPRNDPYDRIKNLGGTNSKGERWTITQPQCIAYIEQDYQFCGERPAGDRVYLVVAVSAG